ncbi:MAG: hypothetical protein KAS66_08125 [Candidatus Omnitrophica bacterium]|nr:hypothetical protein [Candidatus Omnitrophota bacterium]
MAGLNRTDSDSGHIPQGNIIGGTMRLVQTYDNFLRITPPESTRQGNFKKNKYDVYREMMNFDNEVSGGLMRIAAVVEKAFDGVGMEPDGNSKLLDLVIGILDEMRFSKILGSLVVSLGRDGDVIHIPVGLPEGDGKNFLKKEIRGMSPLPTNILTIIDSGTPKGGMDAGYVITQRETYILNEQDIANWGGNNKDHRYNGKNIWHMSIGARDNWTLDIKSRNTYGLWGTSPLHSLISSVRWKAQSIRDDISWRHANVPRFDHAIPLGSVLDLNEYTGTVEERITKAQDAANALLDDYKASMVSDTGDSQYASQDAETVMDVNQGFIHDSETNVSQVGGHHTYADCLPIVKKVDGSIASKLGLPISAFGYEEGSSYAIGKVTAGFMNTFGLHLLNAIQDGTFEYVKKVIEQRSNGKFTEAEWNKIYLKYTVTDFEELKTRVNAWNAAYKGGLAKLGEARNGINLPPIDPDEDEDDINNQFHPGLVPASNQITVNNQPGNNDESEDGDDIDESEEPAE